MKGTESVYAAIYNGGNMVSAGYYNVSGGEVNISGAKKVVTRAEDESCNVTRGDKIDCTRNYRYKLNNGQNVLASSDSNEYQYETKSGKVSASFYHLNNNNGTEQATSEWTMKDMAKIVSYQLGVFGEGKDNRNDYVYTTRADGKNLNEDVIYDTDGGSITLTYIFGGCMNYNMLAYYYWKDDGTETTDHSSCPRYILIEDGRPHKNIKIDYLDGSGAKVPSNTSNSNWPGLAYVDNIKKYDGTISGDSWWSNQTNKDDFKFYGTEYKLVFFGEDGKGTPTYTFPEGYKVAFQLISKRAGWGAQANENNKPSDTELLGTSYDDTQTTSYCSTVADNNSIGVYRSLEKFDKNNHTLKYDIEKGEIAAVTYRAGGHVIMGFEDSPYNDDVDMNDMLFTLDGVKPDEVPVIIPPSDEGQTWILAAEDLGSMDDFDFNDVVASVTYVSGGTTATVKALAAGGTLPIQLKYDGKIVGSENYQEFHSWFGDGNIPSTSMINTYDISYTGDQLHEETITVPEDFTMATCSAGAYSENNMGGFSIEVTRKDKTICEVTPPQKGDAPQMLCLPDTWKWPRERISISEAYSEFGTWGEDYTNSEWLNTADDQKVISTSK